jgi:multiple sugar transport system substrate-binding protein
MKILRRISIILLILSLISCSEKGKEKTIVTFWHAMGGPLGKTLDSLITEFNNEHPAIEIRPVGMGNYQALSQKLMATVAADKPPAISQLYESWTDQFVRADILMPVEDLLDSTEGEKLKEDIYPVFIDDNTWNGKLVTLPFNKSVRAYFYNKTVFQKNGIEHFPETWKDFIDVGKNLTEDTDGDGKTDFWATAFPMSTWMFETLLYQQGGRLLSEDNRTCLFNKREGVEALNILLDILYKYKIGYLTTGYQNQDDFVSGKVAFVSGSVVSYSYISEKEPNFELGIAPVPYSKKKAFLIAGTNIGIFRRSTAAQKKAAMKFIKWFLSPEIQAKWAYGTGYVPVRISSLKEPLMVRRMEELPGLEDVLGQLDYALTEPKIAKWLAGRQILGREGIEPALRGVKSPQESLNESATEINKILREE